MRPEPQIQFERFRLDLSQERLWENEEAVSLTPKAFAVLAYLASHPGRQVAKDELLDAVWGQRHVSDAVLKVAVREIRKTLGDEARAPRFIETVHRRGYRFIAELGGGFDAAAPRPVLVGRSGALERLRGHLEQALEGRRQVVFVTGEPGIGKTTLVEGFLAAAAGGGVWQATGHCLEQFGAGEPYLPVLEALGRLCRGPRRERLLALLRHYAPTWLQQMPALLAAEDRGALERETLGATPERMLREMGETLEALTAEVPLVLVLEDLHWSDYATLDLVSLLARRPEPARLLVLGTYRPADARAGAHPLHHVQRELESRRLSHSLELDFLDEEAIAEYLRGRFGAEARVAGLARPLRRHTDGNPLFMVGVVDYLVSEGALSEERGRWRFTGRLEDLERQVPEEIRQLVQRQVDRLDEGDRLLLTAASVVGIELSAAAVADALGVEDLAVEEACDRLVDRHQFLRHLGARTLPDGKITARYAFVHSLYRQVLYQSLPEARRRRLHRRIGAGGERTYGERAGELAAELAVHFERAGERERAIRYLQQAAATAVRRYANREASDYLTQALELAPDRPPKDALRLELLELRGRLRRAMGDMLGAADDFEALVEAARGRDDRQLEVQALLYLLSALYWVRRDRCLEVIDLAAERSVALEDPLLAAHARGYCAHWNLNLRGWRDADADAFRRALAAAQEDGDPELLSLHLVRDVYFRCWQSDYAGAGRVAEEALELALEVGDAFDYLVAKFFWVWALLHGGTWGRIRPLLEQGIAMAKRNGHELWTLLFGVELAWLHVEAGDPDAALELCAPAVERARRAPQETGQLIFKSLIVRGRAHLGGGRPEAAQRCFSDALRYAEEGIAMDRILEMPLREGLARCGLAGGDLDLARIEARRLCEAAAVPGEATYLALGRRAAIEVALAEGDAGEASRRLAEALAGLDPEAAPLAAWRLYDTAARCRRDAPAEARAFVERRDGVLERLAGALGPDDPLASMLQDRHQE